MTTTNLPTAAIDGLITLADDGRQALLGSSCTACEAVNFPVSPSCPQCGSSSMRTVALASTGTVWTWTVQRFPPKPPYRGATPFAPYAVAYIDLGSVKVEARLAGKTPDAWRIGDSVRLVVGPLDPNDPNYQTFWFEPA
jgi:uncharacterized protein